MKYSKNSTQQQSGPVQAIPAPLGMISVQRLVSAYENILFL